MIGLCGVAFSQGPDQDLRILDSMSRAFDEESSRPVESVTWRLPILACRLYYRESERLPEPDARLGFVDDTRHVQAFVFGKVCPPPVLDCVSRDPLLRARKYFEEAYEEGGIDSLAGVNGHWVAVICDGANGNIVLARDPYGIQIVYYARLGAAVCFSTHLPALENLGFSSHVDCTSVAQFLHFLYVPSPQTILEGVSCVPVGKVALIDRNRVTVGSMHSRIPDPYWKRLRVDGSCVAVDESLNCFDGTLTSAVLERMPPTGRAAIFLSGGKDSASLCVAASKVDPRRFLAVTVGFEDPSIDESEDAAMVAQHLGIEHLILRFSTGDYLDALEEVVRVHGQPFADPAGIPTWLAVKCLPDDIEVVLDGGGNDEYMGMPLHPIERIYLGVPFLRYLARPLALLAPGFLPRRIGRLVRKFRKPLREFFVKWDGWSEQEIRELFMLDPRLGKTELSRLGHSPEARDGVEFKTRALGRTWEAPYRRIVQPANYLGIPTGFPFADLRLVSLFSALPESLCFRGQMNKVLLREYMMRHLPRRIVEKPKRDFVFSLDAFLRASRLAAIQKYLYDDASSCLGSAILARTRPTIRRYVNGDAALCSRVFSLIILRIWLSWLAESSTREAILCWPASGAVVAQ